MTVRINKQKINLREKLTEFEDKVNFDEVVRGLGEYTGNVGIGTANPGSKLEVADGDIRINDQANGATRKIIFDMKNTGGAQTDLSIQASNGNLSFYSEAQAREYMRIESSGNILAGNVDYINTDSAIYGWGSTLTEETGALKWFNSNSGVNKGSLAISTNWAGSWSSMYINRFGASDSGPDANKRYIEFHLNGSSKGTIDYDYSTNKIRYLESSDRRLKENIVDLQGGVDTICKIKPREFIWKENQFNSVGFIADELKEVIPAAVSGDENKVDEKGEPVYQKLNRTELIPYLVQAIKEQQSIIEDLKSRIETLESK